MGPAQLPIPFRATCEIRDTKAVFGMWDHSILPDKDHNI